MGGKIGNESECEGKGGKRERKRLSEGVSEGGRDSRKSRERMGEKIEGEQGKKQRDKRLKDKETTWKKQQGTRT